MNNKSIKTYLSSLINKKDLIIKSIIVLASILIISLFVFLLRNHFLNSKTQELNFMGDFISIKITTNQGISFGQSKDDIVLANTLQSIFFIITFLVAIFTKDNICFTCLFIASYSGLCNLIDRTLVDNMTYNGEIYHNAVVDYFQFKFIKNSAIWNIQDSFIVCSMIILFIYSTVMIIKKGKQDENQVSK